MTRKTVRWGVVAVCLSIMPGSWAVSGGAGERRGEIGVQVGARLPDNDIVPDGDSGTAFTWGIEAAWAFNPKWAMFLDANMSSHDSRQFCANNPNCSALTPTADYTVVTFGMERRLKPNSRGGQWVFGLGTGMMDIEWNGAQIHHGLLALSVGRRCPLGPGTLRWTLRVDSSFSGRTDAQFYSQLDWARLTNVVALVGWGFDFGPRSRSGGAAPAAADPSPAAIAGTAGR